MDVFPNCFINRAVILKNLLPLYLLVMLFFYSCKSTEDQQQSRKISPEPTIQSQIYFFNFYIKSENNQDKIGLINQITSSGKFKESPQKSIPTQSGTLKLVLLDAQDNAIKTIFLSNPLKKTIEYAENNGELTSKTLDLDSAGFNVRINMEPKLAKLNIYQLSQNGYIQLFTTPIKKP